MATTTDFGETWHYVRTTDGITDTEFGLSLDELESFDEVRLDDKTSADSETEADFLNNLPLASYEDIAAGKYTGQDVCVDVVIDKKIDRNYSDSDSCSFSCWIKGNDGYFYLRVYCIAVYDHWRRLRMRSYTNGICMFLHIPAHRRRKMICLY